MDMCAVSIALSHRAHLLQLQGMSHRERLEAPSHQECLVPAAHQHLIRFRAKQNGGAQIKIRLSFHIIASTSTVKVHLPQEYNTGEILCHFSAGSCTVCRAQDCGSIMYTRLYSTCHIVQCGACTCCTVREIHCSSENKTKKNHPLGYKYNTRFFNLRLSCCTPRIPDSAISAKSSGQTSRIEIVSELRGGRETRSWGGGGDRLPTCPRGTCCCVQGPLGVGTVPRRSREWRIVVVQIVVVVGLRCGGEMNKRLRRRWRVC